MSQLKDLINYQNKDREVENVWLSCIFTIFHLAVARNMNSDSLGEFQHGLVLPSSFKKNGHGKARTVLSEA